MVHCCAMANPLPRAAALLILVTPCSAAAQRVSEPTLVVKFDPAQNYKKYRSYSWVSRPMPAGVNQADYERVRASIARSLGSRGFTPADVGDFAVAFKAMPSRSGSYEGSYDDDWGASLSVDIYDTATKQPVWHGVELTRIPSPVSQTTLDGAVDELILRFPPVPAVAARLDGCAHAHPAEEKIVVA